MNIGVDIRHLAINNHSGIGIYTLRTIEHMAEIAPHHTFILFVTGTKKTVERTPSFTQKNIVVEKIPVPNKYFKLLMKQPWGKPMESFLNIKPEVWWFPDSNIIKTNLPYTLTIHDLSFEVYTQFFTFSQRLRHKIAGTKKLAKNATNVLAVSNNTKKDLENIYDINPNKIIVTPLGVESTFHSKEESSDKTFLHTYKINKPYLLALSTREPRKNIESIVEAYDRWRTMFKQANPPKLIIAGSEGWKTKTIHRTISRATHKQDIQLIGYIKEQHKPALFRHADVFIFPSFYEGFGLPVLEAMACGTPVITSFTGSLSELVSTAALTIDPYNVSDIIQALDALEDPKLTERLKQAGIRRAKSFTWQKTAKKTLTAIEESI